MDRKNKIRGSLIGGAIGDALGYQLEFKRNIKEKEYTKYQNDYGMISDDTQMTLFTANGLLWRETRCAMRGIAALPPDAVYESYLDWLDTQNNTNNHSNKISWIKDVKELNVPRAPGNTCIGALSSGKKGTIEAPINDSKGCGGIMRVAPLGLYMRNPEIAGKYGAEVSAITHGHPLANIPSYVFATMLYFILNENLNIEDSLNKAMIQYKEKFNVYDKKYYNYFKELVEKAIKLSKENISDVDAIYELGEGWVAEETFAIAIYSCLKYQNSFTDAVICSVNHDGDSDSTGAVVGNIMGVYLGYDAIPDYYKNNIELKDVILEIADDLSIYIPVGEYNENNDGYWLSKYLYCKKKKGSVNMNEKDKKVEEFEINKNTNVEGWDAITRECERVYQYQKNPKHYAPIIKYKFGGNDPLDGISIYDGGDYWHFVTYGLSELYEKETDIKEISGYGMEFTFKLKKDNYINEESEIKCICNILQSIARITFSRGEIFKAFEYLYTGQTTGIDSNQKSNITGFITVPDDKLKEIYTPNGKVIFVEFIGVTDAELKAIYNKQITVKELYEKLGTNITDYNRKSIIN